MALANVLSQTIHRQSSLQRCVEADLTMVSVALPLILGVGVRHVGEELTRRSQYAAPLHTVYP